MRRSTVKRFVTHLYMTVLSGLCLPLASYLVSFFLMVHGTSPRCMHVQLFSKVYSTTEAYGCVSTDYGMGHPPFPIPSNIHWKDWCWSSNSNTLATWCEELTHLKRPWCWERLRAGGEGDNRRWDSWTASLTQWTWVWVDSGSWWWTGRPGVLQFTGSQSRTQLSDWTELNWICKQLTQNIGEWWNRHYKMS